MYFDDDRGADGPLQHVRHAANEHPEIGAFEIQILTAGKGKQPLSQRCSAPCCLQGIVDQGLGLGRG
jgi:hypothetical protein